MESVGNTLSAYVDDSFLAIVCVAMVLYIIRITPQQRLHEDTGGNISHLVHSGLLPKCEE